ncbi:hypothetical protein GSI_04876 [Ganoderma sinense ZZ0214-1]|uniref:Uncharacterized protein n=1 Tax=Ganoderma sinense ZZ0214-1 TaxID=1077348 RepID=A0A2G8SG83_9APHY|nr:hypothetical protein GSI_04876 [Ganoderma sinense ZZ0214-1]
MPSAVVRRPTHPPRPTAPVLSAIAARCPRLRCLVLPQTHPDADALPVPPTSAHLRYDSDSELGFGAHPAALAPGPAALRGGRRGRVPTRAAVLLDALFPGPRRAACGTRSAGGAPSCGSCMSCAALALRLSWG